MHDPASIINGQILRLIFKHNILIGLYTEKPEVYTQTFSQKINDYLEKYYDSKKGNSSALFTELVHSIMNDQN